MNETAIRTESLKDNYPGIYIGHFDDVMFANSLQLHRHDYWEIFLFKQGDGRHLIDFEETEFRAGSVHFVLPHHVHQLKNISNAEGLVLKVSDELFHASNENKELIPELCKYQLFHKAPVLHFSSEEFSDLWDIAERMQKESHRQVGAEAVVLKNYLNILLCKCRKNIEVSGTAPIIRPELELFISFRHLVEKYFKQYTKIQDYLRLLGVSEKKLFLVCSLYTGTSPSDYLHKRILAEAKRLLRFSPTCQKEIAYTLNFTDLPHFIKFFKQKTGLLPKEFASGFLTATERMKNEALTLTAN
jgi:AraC family transcriptional activator of pobA